MKAIITAAGLGTRSGLNGVIRKELLSIYESREGAIVLRPIIDVLISRLTTIGVKDIAVVLDPTDRIARLYIESVFPNVHLFFQRERKGFGDAVLSAREFIENEGFLVAAGDGLILDFEGMGSLMRDLEEHRKWTIFVMKVDNPRKYGVAVLDHDRSPYEVSEVVEKPEVPKSNYAICAFYYLPPEILGFIQYEDGKAELTRMIDKAIKVGIKFSAVEIPKEQWISVGRVEDYLSVLNRSYSFAREKLF